jgi:hypothetical protein
MFAQNSEQMLEDLKKFHCSYNHDEIYIYFSDEYWGGVCGYERGGGIVRNNSPSLAYQELLPSCSIPVNKVPC